MSSTNTVADVHQDYRYVWEFEEGGCLYKRCKDSCLALSRTMGVDFKAVYRNSRVLIASNNTWADKGVSWDGEQFYAVNPKGKVIVFYNSEWGGVEFDKK
ncbi:hypothetical protein D3C80_877700 [compost metagenome]